MGGSTRFHVACAMARRQFETPSLLTILKCLVSLGWRQSQEVLTFRPNYLSGCSTFIPLRITCVEVDILVDLSEITDDLIVVTSVRGPINGR